MPIERNDGADAFFGGDMFGLFAADHEVSRLQRVMAFCEASMDDVLICPVTRERVRFYLDVDAEVTRRADVLELEKQWNPLRRM